ncbi:MAG TPA: PA14 domain-containing protein [Clostridiales bacterium]|nr:PA14 domain-containing protein [Clostridiales bacterium]
MKKFLSIILVALLVFATFVSPVSADSKHNKNDENLKKKYMNELKTLKGQLKCFEKQYQERLKIMKQLEKLKKKYNDKHNYYFDDDFDLEDLWLLINGEEFLWKGTPVIRYGSFLLPIKPITEGLKADLKYDDKKHVISITKGDTKIVIDLEGKVITVNGEKVNWDIFNKKSSNGTIVLVKVIATVLGHDVDGDDDSGVIIIDDKYTSFNNNDVRLEYKGSWTYLQNQKDAYMGDLHVSNDKDASFKFSFNGTKIKLYGVKGPDKGNAIIKLDGKEQTVNLFSYTTQNNAIIYASTELKEGPHTLEVKVSGSKYFWSKGYSVAVDRVDVMGESVKDWNIAINKPASADSHEVNNTPQKANDGSLSTRWCAADDATGHWWMVDLGGYYNLTGTEIVWEFDEKLYKYKVDVSANGSDWTLALDKANNNLKQQVQNEKFSANSVKYVRVTVTGLEPGCWASFYETKIFGYPASASQPQVPGAPESLTAKSVSDTEILLSWKAPTLNAWLSGYKIYRNGTHIGTVGTTANNLTYKDTGLTPGTAYEYTIRAYNSQNVNSSPSSTLKVSTFGNGTGLKAEYYDKVDFTEQKLLKSDDLINFIWGSNPPNTYITDSTFSVRWSGKVQPLYSGKYTFYTLSDGGVHVWVNDSKVIDDWTEHAISEKSGTIELTAGNKYDIKVEYYNESGSSQIQLFWSGDSQQKEIIPKRQFYID